MELLDGVRAATATTSRMRTHYLESGPADAPVIVMVHGNLSTGRFYEHLMPRLPQYRIIAPDMRGFGRSEPLPLDATRGLDDWADDVHALLEELGVTAPVHLVGWSTGGAAIARFACARPVASLTFVDPVSPHGYGGVHDDGTPCAPDFAGSGGGGANPEVVRLLREKDRTADSPFSARSLLRSLYWVPSHQEPREDLLVDEVLMTLVGDDGYPGDGVPSDNWPGTGPGTRGILNALSPKYCDWTGIADLADKPPVLWTQGDSDLVIADGSPLEFGTLGAAGHVPGWPGQDAYPPQRMVSQIRAFLERYAAAGGVVHTTVLEGSGHGPIFDATDRWLAAFTEFLATIE